MLGAARRVRVYDRRGPVEPARKRRDRVNSSLLADVTDAASVAVFARTLGVRPDSELMDWMEHPGLWFVFDGEDGRPIVRLGLLAPGWLRWDPHGDVRLAAPGAVRDGLCAWGIGEGAQ
ncbi:hypothetical protein ACQPZJ_42860 [Actinoplanes sp. CA-054009]